MTAEEFLDNCRGKAYYNESMNSYYTVAMIEFAKFHVEAALKAKIEAMQEHMNGGYSLDEIDSFTYNAYPLDKIL